MTKKERLSRPVSFPNLISNDLVNLHNDEQQIQSKKIKELEALGYYVLKLIKTNKNGIPDLLALHPDKTIRFIVRVKTSKGKVSKLQQYRIEMNSMDMDSKQKYTRDDYFYELENNFIDILETLPISLSCIIIFQLDQAVAKSDGLIIDSNDRLLVAISVM